MRETTARLDFWCPECGASIAMYLNIGCVRKAGENGTTCPHCHAKIHIQIDVMAEPVPLLEIERDADGKATAIHL